MRLNFDVVSRFSVRPVVGLRCSPVSWRISYVNIRGRPHRCNVKLRTCHLVTYRHPSVSAPSYPVTKLVTLCRTTGVSATHRRHDRLIIVPFDVSKRHFCAFIRTELELGEIEIWHLVERDWRGQRALVWRFGGTYFCLAQPSVLLSRLCLWSSALVRAFAPQSPSFVTRRFGLHGLMLGTSLWHVVDDKPRGGSSPRTLLAS